MRSPIAKIGAATLAYGAFKKYRTKGKIKKIK